MNRLYFVSHYRHQSNHWERFLITVPDGSDEGVQAVIDYYRAEYGGNYGRVSAEFVCMTAETVWKAV